MGLLKFVRGSVWWYDFTDKCVDTRVMIGKHPCVIISNDIYNKYRSVVSVLPITSNLEGFGDCYKVKIPSVKGDKEASAVLCNQIRTVDVRDLFNFEGILEVDDLRKIENKLLHLLGIGDESVEMDIPTENAVVEEEKPVEIEEIDVVEEEQPAVNHKTWCREQKTQYLLDYNLLDINEVIKKYGFSNKKAAQQKAYECRKSIGTTKKYQKLAKKVMKKEASA